MASRSSKKSAITPGVPLGYARVSTEDRKSTRLNSSHPSNSYAVFCLKKEDYDLYLRIAKLGVKFCPIHDYLVKHRRHNENSSKLFLEMRLAELSVLFFLKNGEPTPFSLFPKTCPSSD